MSTRWRWARSLDDYRERFWSKTTRAGECIEWTGSISTRGYGKFHYRKDGKNFTLLAHRWAYVDRVGEIPDGLVLDHPCRNRKCVNPDHLEPVTNRENILRGESTPPLYELKSHCPKGHPYDEKNTYVTPKGVRDCRACRRDAGRRYKRRIQDGGRCRACHRIRYHEGKARRAALEVELEAGER